MSGSRNVRTASYRQMLGHLPAWVASLADHAFVKFRDNPAHPSLKLHPLSSDGRGRHRAGSFSVSVNRQYRAIYAVDGETNVWYWIGTHNDYDVFTGRR